MLAKGRKKRSDDGLLAHPLIHFCRLAVVVCVAVEKWRRGGTSEQWKRCGRWSIEKPNGSSLVCPSGTEGAEAFRGGVEEDRQQKLLLFIVHHQRICSGSVLSWEGGTTSDISSCPLCHPMICLLFLSKAVRRLASAAGGRAKSTQCGGTSAAAQLQSFAPLRCGVCFRHWVIQAESSFGIYPSLCHPADAIDNLPTPFPPSIPSPLPSIKPLPPSTPPGSSKPPSRDRPSVARCQRAADAAHSTRSSSSADALAALYPTG